MTASNGRAFNEWLRSQLKAKKMSQRQLAQQSGVDHSTISRLVRGDRMPSLGTATKLARGLRELADDAEGPQYLGLMNSAVQHPTARVEYALRADDSLSEPQVRQIMEYYLAVRMRRLGRSFTPDNNPVVRPFSPSSQAGRTNSQSSNTARTSSTMAVSSGRVALQGRPPTSLPPRLRTRTGDGY
jgi:transcriptional regulator with XRE-family HTH domain